MVEGARLEIWCGARPHLGFESLSLRKIADIAGFMVISVFYSNIENHRILIEHGAILKSDGVGLHPGDSESHLLI